MANLPHGTAVLIVCTTRGDVVVSPDGRGSDLWNYIAPTDLGPAGFIPDAWVYTGTDEPTRPECA
ncbi:hypothetical protein [Blastococcus xanthinilyticus]|uniref:hypothetical protein n=1 Tax=Blastococcus xanthinilyticus TaxID=1564164 RepID=UPI0014130EC2|nr:hypothetical protein [Blastococcus xanthinilyticus]